MLLCRTPQRAPGILQAAKAAAPLHVYAPAALQKAPVAPKPAVPTQAEISLAREQAKRADEDVAKLDIEILRMQNKLKQVGEAAFQALHSTLSLEVAGNVYGYRPVHGTGLLSCCLCFMGGGPLEPEAHTEGAASR